MGLRNLRRDAGMSLADLASASGCDASQISKFERWDGAYGKATRDPRNMSLSTAHALASALGVCIDVLWYELGRPDDTPTCK